MKTFTQQIKELTNQSQEQKDRILYLETLIDTQNENIKFIKNQVEKIDQQRQEIKKAGNEMFEDTFKYMNKHNLTMTDDLPFIKRVKIGNKEFPTIDKKEYKKFIDEIMGLKGKASTDFHKEIEKYIEEQEQQEQDRKERFNKRITIEYEKYQRKK